MKNIRTHSRIDNSLSGFPEIVKDGYAVVRLKTDDRMVADDTGLIHGGFIFSAADYAAMLSLASHRDVWNFSRVCTGGHCPEPVVKGDEVIFEARLDREEGKKKIVSVVGMKEEEEVFRGSFICVVPKNHVLKKDEIKK
ncbi:MAG: PaaI family thioesterase [Aquificota bacterium]|nr:PaaI family thioesterase [Aquificota bacterium]